MLKETILNGIELRKLIQFELRKLIQSNNIQREGVNNVR
jgi:hypothetical protein